MRKWISETSRRFSVNADQDNKRAILRLVDTLPGGDLLDLGCSDGTFTREIAERMGAGTASGVEIDVQCAQAAEERGIDVRRQDLNEKLPFAADRFDLILANQVIEHLYFTDDFIEEVHRVLKPAGTLILSTTNLAAIHYRLMLLIGWQPTALHPAEIKVGNHLRGGTNPRYGHKSVFTYRALLEFLRHHGFHILKAQSVAVHPLPSQASALLCRLRPAWGIYATVKAKKVSRRS